MTDPSYTSRYGGLREDIKGLPKFDDSPESPPPTSMSPSTSKSALAVEEPSSDIESLDESIQAAIDRLGVVRPRGASGHDFRAAEKEAKAGLASGSDKARKLVSNMKTKREFVSPVTIFTYLFEKTLNMIDLHRSPLRKRVRLARLRQPQSRNRNCSRYRLWWSTRMQRLSETRSVLMSSIDVTHTDSLILLLILRLDTWGACTLWCCTCHCSRHCPRTGQVWESSCRR